MDIDDLKENVKLIVKRKGHKEPFDETKFKRYLLFVTDNDSQMAEILLRDTFVKLKEETKVKVLANAIVDTAVSKISPLQTKWEYVAARAYLLNLYSESYGIKDGRKYPHLNDVLKKGVSAGIYSKEVYDMYSAEEIDTLHSYIRPEEDLTFTYDALKQFVSKYCKDLKRGQKLELPQITYMRVAMGLCYNLPDKMEVIPKLYDILTKGQATLATPIMMNSFTNLNQFSSCILNTVGNSTDDIANKIATAMLYTKGKGGLAFDVTPIQAKGTTTSNGTSASGIVPYIQEIQTAITSMMQADNRRGSGVITLAWWHYEIEEFLELKDASSGTPETRALLLKYAIATDKVFKEAVLADADIKLFCPKSAPELLELSGDAFAEKYAELCQKGGLTCKTVNAKQLYKKYIKYRYQTGNMYETMLDNINNANMTNRHVGSSNLCVAPETKILTDKGYTEIKSLVNQEVNVWNGEQFSKVTVKKTSDASELITVATTGGVIECTPDHKFYVQQSYKYNDFVEVRAKDLKPSDRLIKFKLPVIKGSKILEKPYINGFFTGDGTQVSNGHIVYLYNHKKKLIDKFSSPDVTAIYENKDRITIKYENGSLKQKYFVPDSSYTVFSRLAWFAGLIDADGCLTSNNGTQSIQVVQVNHEFLYETQLMLQTLGVSSKVVASMDKGQRYLPKNNGTGETALYQCKEAKRLLIGESGVQHLLDLGIDKFLSRILPEKRTPNRNAEHFIKVLHTKNEGRISDTYCFTEPIRHMGIFNGVLTGQCQEIVEPSRAGENYNESFIQLDGGKPKYIREWDTEEIALCNLASYNVCITDLPREELDEIVYIIHKVVDNTITIGKYMRASSKTTNLDYRYVGLGMNNFAYWLANSKILFDSDEAEVATFLMTQKLSLSIIRSSARLAKELGAFPKFRETKWAEGVLPFDLANEALIGEFVYWINLEEIEEARQLIKMYGSRNALLMAVAPTASSATSKGLTESIEPVMKLSYTLEGAVSTQVLVPDLARLRQWYQTAYTIDPKRLVKLNAIRQMWLDQSQSCNMYIDTDKWNYGYLAKLHLYAWKLGTKTLYYLWTPKSEVEEACANCSA